MALQSRAVEVGRAAPPRLAAAATSGFLALRAVMLLARQVVDAVLHRYSTAQRHV